MSLRTLLGKCALYYFKLYNGLRGLTPIQWDQQFLTNLIFYYLSLEFLSISLDFTGFSRIQSIKQ